MHEEYEEKEWNERTKKKQQQQMFEEENREWQKRQRLEVPREHTSHIIFFAGRPEMGRKSQYTQFFFCCFYMEFFPNAFKNRNWASRPFATISFQGRDDDGRRARAAICGLMVFPWGSPAGWSSTHHFCADICMLYGAIAYHVNMDGNGLGPGGKGPFSTSYTFIINGLQCR